MNEHKTLAGALIFAFAARDNEALMSALHGVRDYGNPTAVMLELAATAAGFLQELCGDEWQAALSAALLDVASEGCLMALDSGAYRQMRRELRGAWAAAQTPCWLCGQRIDYSLPASDPASFELEHKLPRRTHPHLEMDPRNCAPSHKKCNRSKGSNVHVLALGETTEDW